VDGTEGEVDFPGPVRSEGAAVLAQLRDPELFAGVHVKSGAVVWPGEVDLAPDAMYDEKKSRPVGSGIREKSFPQPKTGPVFLTTPLQAHR